MGLVLSTAAVIIVSLYLFKLTEKYCSSADTTVKILHETICKSNICRSRYEKLQINTRTALWQIVHENLGEYLGNNFHMFLEKAGS